MERRTDSCSFHLCRELVGTSFSSCFPGHFAYVQHSICDCHKSTWGEERLIHSTFFPPQYIWLEKHPDYFLRTTGSSSNDHDVQFACFRHFFPTLRYFPHTTCGTKADCIHLFCVTLNDKIQLVPYYEMPEFPFECIADISLSSQLEVCI